MRSLFPGRTSEEKRPVLFSYYFTVLPSIEQLRFILRQKTTPYSNLDCDSSVRSGIKLLQRADAAGQWTLTLLERDPSPRPTTTWEGTQLRPIPSHPIPSHPIPSPLHRAIATNLSCDEALSWNPHRRRRRLLQPGLLLLYLSLSRRWRILLRISFPLEAAPLHRFGRRIADGTVVFYARRGACTKLPWLPLPHPKRRCLHHRRTGVLLPS